MSARDERAPAGKVLLTDGWISHLRKQHRLVKCPRCDTEIPKSLDNFREHMRTRHGNLDQDTTRVEAEFAKIDLGGASELDTSAAPRLPAQRQPQPTRKRQNFVAEPNEPGQTTVDTSDEPDVKRIRSPPLATRRRGGPASPSTPKTSNGRKMLEDTTEEFSRGAHRAPASGRKLFDPATDSATRGRGRGGPKTGGTRPSPAAQPKPNPLNTFAQGHVRSFIQPKPQRPNSVQEREPITTPMTPPQLAAEVKKLSRTIMDGQERCTAWILVKKANPKIKITNEEWYEQWLEHRALLNNHYDLLMACQDPAGQGTLTHYPVEKEIPAKLWQFGIYEYLELLRTRLPDSYEPLLCFLYTAYGILGLLRETNLLFQDTWTECIGDLARYRYAIESNEEVREHWEVVSRTWYMYTSDKLPHVGRLYHHFAVLNRGYVVPQLCYWAKSLCVALPFDSTRASIRKLFDPLFAQAVLDPFRHEMQSVHVDSTEQATDGKDAEDAEAAASPRHAVHNHQMVDMTFALVFGVMFTREHADLFDEAREYFLRSLDLHIAQMSRRWLDSGYQMGIAVTCNLFGYWHKRGNGFKWIVLPNHFKKDVDSEVVDTEATLREFDVAYEFLIQVYEIVTRRTGDTNTLPFMHTIFTFLLHVSKYPTAMSRVAERFPWALTADMLNYWLFTAQNNKSNPQFTIDTFPGHKGEEPTRPLPEDFAMRGLLYAEDYFPLSWFKNCKVEFEERYFEPRSLVDLRVERLLWIATQLGKAGDWLVLDGATQTFRAAERFAVEVGC